MRYTGRACPLLRRSGAKFLPTVTRLNFTPPCSESPTSMTQGLYRYGLAVLSLLATSLLLSAQTITLDELPADASFRTVDLSKAGTTLTDGAAKMMPCNNAGTILGFTAFELMSNSFGMVDFDSQRTFGTAEIPDTIFLCDGDRFALVHGGGEDLSGDPNASTIPGVGYVAFGCDPTTDGPTIADIRADPCVSAGGLSPFDALAIVVPSGYATGNYSTRFSNRGAASPTPFFPDVDGDPGPVVLTIAPITFDGIINNGSGDLAGYENNGSGPVGQCVNLRQDQSFKIAYLTPLEVNQDANAPCGGSFTITGGVPQLDGAAGYDFALVNTSNGNTATITTPANQIRHGATVSYTVPSAGTYRMVVSDRRACESAVIEFTHTGADCAPADPVGLVLPTGTIQPGQTKCFPVTASDFTDINGFSFAAQFDPAVLQFTEVTGENANLVTPILANGPVSSGGTLPEGNLRILYDGSASSIGATIPDGDVVFEICFTGIGIMGNSSDLIPDTGFAAEFSRTDGTSGDLNITNGFIEITNQPFPIEITTTPETCSGEDDGTITATVNGTDGPYTFGIRRVTPPEEVTFMRQVVVAGNPAEATFDALGAATYEIQVISASNEISLATAVVDVDLILIVNLTTTRVTCNGDSDGVAVANVEADGVELTPADLAAQGYTFTWNRSPDSTRSLLDGITAGPVAVTVTAPNGAMCQSIATGNVGEPQPLVIRPEDQSMAVTLATCSGSMDGGLEISATGGRAPYDFFWPTGLGDDINVSMSSRMSLTAGDYTITVVDDNGCEQLATYTVGAVKTLIINENVANVTCFDEANGSITVVGSFNGANPVGNFFITLRNNQTGVELPEVEQVVGSDPIVFNGLDTGSYTIILRDEDPQGCFVEETYRIIQPEELVIGDDVTVVDETCTTGMDGSATITVTGGTQPYTFRVLGDSLERPLDTLLTGPMITGISADSFYQFIVTDANGCTDTVDFIVGAPAGAFIAPIQPDFVSCPGDTDGQLMTEVIVPDGLTSTSIIWYRLNADSSISEIVAENVNMTLANLSVGLYAIEVTTSNGCVSARIGVVASPDPVTLSDTTLVSPICAGESSGSITITPTGGTPNPDGSYNIRWSTDPGTVTTNPTLDALAAGTYSVTVTDANNCEPAFEGTFTLEDPPAITGTFGVTNVSCPDDDIMDGMVTFTAAYDDGTQGTYTFTWMTADGVVAGNSTPTSSTLTGLGRGRVEVIVTDGTCTASFDTIIGSPEEFMVETMVDPVSCNGDMNGAVTLDVTGGTGSYIFDWSASTDTDNAIDGLAAGPVTAVVTDENGCNSDTIRVTITEPDPLTLAIDSVASTPTVSCAGDTDGRISVFVNSVNSNPLGDAPYSWSGGVAPPESSTAMDLSPGMYSVTVTDVEGCRDSIDFTIAEPQSINFTVLPIEEPLCFGETTPIFIDTIIGGTNTAFNEFTFSVNNDGFRVRADQEGAAFAGDIVVTVFDNNECTASDTFSVNQPPEIVIDLPEEIIVELGDSLTRLNPIVTPAGDVYTYEWTPATFLSADSVRNPFIFPLQDIDYDLKVTNSNGCMAFADIFVEVDANRNVYIPNAFSPNRDGRNEDFRVFACQGVQRVVNVAIYDRWGGLVFQADDLPPNCLDGIQLWDGTAANGKPVNSGVFVYIVQVAFLDNNQLTYRGDVTVIR